MNIISLARMCIGEKGIDMSWLAPMLDMRDVNKTKANFWQFGRVNMRYFSFPDYI
jgi:hypothetical protein